MVPLASKPMAIGGRGGQDGLLLGKPAATICVWSWPLPAFIPRPTSRLPRARVLTLVFR